MPTISLSPPWEGALNRYSLYQKYGHNEDTQPYEPAGHGWAHWHTGWDMELLDKTPLLACADGTVWRAQQLDPSGPQFNGSYGLYLCIEYDNPDGSPPHVSTLFGHCSRHDVRIGDRVKRGQQVGLSGGDPPQGVGTNSGNSSGAHLHLMTLLDRNIASGDVDLAPYFSGAGVATGGGGGGASGGVVTPASSGTVTPANAIYWAKAAGIPADQMAVCIAICRAESQFKLDATNYNRDNAGAIVSTDRGLWQINDLAHPEYPNHDLLFQGAYNAQAMAAISAKGTNWNFWSTYNPPPDPRTGIVPSPPYLTYMDQARSDVALTPNGTAPAGVGGSSAGSGGSAGAGTPSYDATTDPVPQDTTPQLPVEQVRVAPGRLQWAALHRDAARAAHLGLIGTAAVSIGGELFPVESLSVVEAAYRQPGSLKATLPYALFTTERGRRVMRQFFRQRYVEVKGYLGYMAPDAGGAEMRRCLRLVFVGLIESPDIDVNAENADETVTLSCPDLSILLSGQAATSSQLSALGDNFANQRADQIVSRLLLAHNAPGPAAGQGLTVEADTTGEVTGSVFGTDAIKTRRSGQKEYDICVQLAQDQGYDLYFDGSVLVFKRPAAPPAPLVLTCWQSGGAAVGPVSRVHPVPQPHAGREYKVTYQSFDPQTGQALTATARKSNHDSPSEETLTAPAGTSARQLQRMADAALAVYVATEVLTDIETTDLVPLTRGQAVVLRSDYLPEDMTGPAHPLYPLHVERSYEPQTGIALSIRCGTRPWGIAQTDTSRFGF